MAYLSITLRTEMVSDEDIVLRVRAAFTPLVQQAGVIQVLLNAPREDPKAGYFATAILGDAHPDPLGRGGIILYLTDIESFRTPVSLRENEQPYESAALSEDGRFLGFTYRQQLRALTATEFEAVIRAAHRDAGFQQEKDQPNTGFIDAFSPPRRRRLVETIIRDRKLRWTILENFGSRCAVLKYEAYDPWTGSSALEACHIQPVQYGGADTAINALLLERDVHWHFDRGLWTSRITSR